MSSEIVSAEDGSGNNSNKYIPSLGQLNLRRAGNVPSIKVDLIGGNHPMKHFISPEKGHKQITQSNPTPDSMKSLLKGMKDPSVLLLRGCDQLFLPSAPDFPFERFKTLTSLEISGVSHLTALPEKTISEMTQLQSLELSHLPLEFRFPGDFFSNLCNLRSLVLKGCSGLYRLRDVGLPHKLQYLDLSFLHFPELSRGFFRELEELRWLILRGCYNLITLPSVSYLNKLEVLDVSHCTTLRRLEAPRLERRPCLKMVDISYTDLPKIPYLDGSDNLTHLFLSGTKATMFYFYEPLINLQVLDLSGSKNLTEVDWLEANKNLLVLDLSRTGIESIDILSDLIHLRNLILRECFGLVKLPAMKRLTNLEVLDISCCYNLDDLPEDLNNLGNLKELNLSGCLLQELREGLFDQMSCLEKLDLSSNYVNHLPSFSNLIDLQILNISQTDVSTLPDMSMLVNLKELLLANVQLLQVLPDVQALVNLETLDLSLGDDYEYPDNNLQVESEIDAQSGQFLSAPRRLRKLVLAKRPGVVKLFPQASLDKLEYLDLRGNNEIDCIEVDSSRMGNLQEVVGWDGNIHPTPVQGKISKCDEIHLVSTFVNKSSGFDRFKYELRELEDLISHIQEKFKSSSPDKLVSTTGDFNAAAHDRTCNGSSKGKIQYQLYKRHFGRIHEDLKYVLKHLGHLESSDNCKSSENLLHKLFDVATYLSACSGGSPLDYTKLNELFRIVAKLKLLVPPRQVDDRKEGKAVNDVSCFDEYYETPLEVLKEEEIQKSYDSLTIIEKNCLLCFAVFPVFPLNVDMDHLKEIMKRFKIKKRTLIQWWIGEGFIDEENSTTKGVKPNTVEEIGEQILKVLEEKNFIVPLKINIYWESASCSMLPSVHSFVTRRAMEEGSFDFHHENHKLTPHLQGSERACLLKSEDNLPSSCQLWSDYTNSSEKLERFKTIRALFNINENMIYIKAEWFSKMRNLCALHLGSLDYKNEERIEISDLKFMEELKKMKHLRLLSLKGFSAIGKLPDSVCKLTNLKILNLRDCGYLEELPDGIGSLKQLTHLDLTNCHNLSKLPKEVSSLPKLEVLKGFVITYQIGSGQHRKACTLRELLKLKSLRKLNLIVNADRFPCIEDLRVFRDMTNLCNLKITWEKSYNTDQELPDEAVLMDSRWQQLKCWEQRTRQNNDAEEQSRSHHLGNLKKLFLYCFPSETAPHWLHPGELQNLEKLYIEGGNLKSLLGDTNQNRWNVKTLRMMNLSHFEIDWGVLRGTFPNMTLLWCHEIKDLSDKPEYQFYHGVWSAKE